MSDKLNATIALEGQSFLDIAIKSGNLENIFKIDPNISITGEPLIGKEYTFPVNNDMKDILTFKFIRNNKIEPATALSVNDILISTSDDGIGSMIIENSFYIR
jgi:hypothetical protein